MTPGFLLGWILGWCGGLAVPAVEFPLQWRWSNPTPHGNNIVDMAYSSGLGLAVQVAERGQLYTSTDLRLWLPRRSGTSQALRAVTFFGDKTIVTGEKGTVLHATSVLDFQPGTLVSGSTEDWLEAVAASQSLVVAVGDQGAIYTSTNGVHWKRQTVPFADWLRGVAYGNGLFVAVGEEGFYATSPNGTNWTARSPFTTADLNRITFGNGRFFAVGDRGLVRTSINGTVWEPESLGASNDLFHGCISSDAKLVVGTNEVWLQTGGTWSNQLARADGPPDWVYYACLPRPDFFLMGGQTGMLVEGFRTNASPYFWRPSTGSLRNWLWDVTYASHLYVAVGDRATIMTSGNGIDWSLELVPEALTNAVFLGVGGTTNLLVAAGSKGSLMISPNALTNFTTTITNGTNIIITNITSSTLGVFWHAVSSSVTNDLQGVAVFNELFVVTGSHGKILTSSDGTNWFPRNSTTSKLLSGVTAWPGGLVAVGDNGAIVTSPDGTNWTVQTSYATTNWLYRVRYLGGKLIIVGQNGTLLTSLTGTEWTPHNNFTSLWLNDVALIAGTFFAVGTQGAFLSSPDGVNWTNQFIITRKSLYGAATDGQQLVTVGIEGIILRSPVVPDLTPPQILNYSRLTSASPPSAQNLFLFAGQPDQQFTLDYRAGLETNGWLTGPLLEFFDSSGTFFYVETIFGTNSPDREFYRTTLVP